MGEEVAIETLKSGATDYVLKTRLSRLVPALSFLGQHSTLVAGFAALLAVASTAFQVGVSRRAAPSSSFGTTLRS